MIAVAELPIMVGLAPVPGLMVKVLVAVCPISLILIGKIPSYKVPS